MSATRLSPLDASFLEVETPTAHMHVGWVALFSPPADRPKPTFAAFREHIEGRLGRAPRYRQRLAAVPLGVNGPCWVDDDQFDARRHVRHATATSITRVVERVMSEQLDRAYPLWQIWIADRLDDGRIGVVGKAHHCMVDGIAAVELAALLLDLTPQPPPADADQWRPQPAPGALRLLTEGVRDRVVDGLGLARFPARIVRSPRQAFTLARQGERAARALAHSFTPPAPRSLLNRPNSPRRHLARVGRPLDDLMQIKRHFDTTLNDVVLAVSSGGMRSYLARRGEEPARLKSMVPVNVRNGGGAGELGNRISFLFVELPCDEPDPVRRLLDIHMTMSDRKRSGEPEGGDSVLKAVSYAPQRVQHLVSRLVASPRVFNFVVSNIPGPREPMYMLGCELDEVYPIVPLTDRHGVSIGVTTIKDGAYFGIYADRDSLPDAPLLADDIDEAVDELLART
jgi:diacylglycerol O-acyltransferase